MDDELKHLRAQIDALDSELLSLINRRAELASEVGQIKRLHNAPVYRPDRELQVISRQQASNSGPLKSDHVAVIWREIMSACRSLEAPERVAFLGPLGTFSEQAADIYFGASMNKLPCNTIDDVFRTVSAKGAEFGVVPIENSTEGAIARTLDLLLTTELRLCGEVSLSIRHNLLRKKATLEGIDAVCAHPQALAQCHAWLSEHLPGVERRAVSSNAEGARMASQSDTLAAIASEHAGDKYGLCSVHASIQDDPSNRTRFGVLGHWRPAPSGHDRTSLVLSVPNKAGAVFEMLKPLAQHGVSMSRFESRPARSGTWEYYFYVDVEGHEDEAEVSAALEALRAQCAYFKCLGSYPVARR
jgi:chorismate mutase / prephenate dehydratase